ncbi:cytochrome d ubiquinol oxidase subunit II [Engelhardtia mirabilis]|uniref:Cytochrome oxidase subunit II n=1 Tax=Engelhardtia mirabilis TaxID=2528011 RepID=A0A518BGL2_9BACT|nr:Cytochrome oxidase subunit II [Planctomycetes bacterium Pla133]QDV00438.1 Cytochrome oxidase subunit II [Planctomycetes bacterium Pla86]
MTPEPFVLALLLLALGAYALLGGADFGAGVWEFQLGTRPAPADRRLIARAIGPVWEVNHIWLLFLLILLFTCYPPAFERLCRELYLPLLLALAGIVARGAGFVFRSYGPRDLGSRTLWTAVFAFASTTTPFFLGASLGAVASFELGVDDARPAWTHPLAIYSGFLGVAICAFLAAVFLVREARRGGDSELEESWRQRALVSGAWAGAAAGIGLLFVRGAAPELAERLYQHGELWIGLSISSGLATMVALALRRPTLASATAAGAVLGVLFGVAHALYPQILPPTMDLASARAEDVVLWTVVWGVACGLVILLPSLWLLFRLFKSDAPPNP